ncbi:MAG: putative addiction module antidote protein [Magnetococcales bacterium]|nr:putative addiction module antidote protein [Magnetococcales bacterium]
MNTTISDFDPAAYLDNEEMIAEYISQVLADGDTEELMSALGHIVKARGMSKIAQSTGLGRESLYKALTPGAQPRFATVMKVIRALGIKLHAVPV